MSYRKKLIEVALPLEAINAASAREKSIRHGHPSTLHLWWSRKPSATARAVLFASLVDDPSARPEKFPTLEAQEKERRRLFDLIEQLVLWGNVNNTDLLAQAKVEIARSTDGSPPPVLDPFAGGGSIPLEAQRLGLEAHASDLNPVAVLINKAMIEIPPRFANQAPVNPEARAQIQAGGWQGGASLADDVRYYGQWLRDEAEKSIGQLYPKAQLPDGSEATVIAWKWARTVKCPNPACGAEMPLVSSYWLSKKKGKEAWLECLVRDGQVEFLVRNSRPNAKERLMIDVGTGFLNDKGKRTQATFLCPVCRDGIAKGDYIDDEANAQRMGHLPLAIIAESTAGRIYLSFPRKLADEVTEAILYYEKSHNVLNSRPLEPCRGTFASNAQGRRYGFTTFGDYFTSRQLIALLTFSDLIHVAMRQAEADALAVGLPDDGIGLDQGGCGARAYGEAICVYLAFVLDKLLDRSSAICSWDSSRDGVRNTFARQAIPMIWDYAEANPFSSSSGCWDNCMTWVGKYLETSPASAFGHAMQRDATAPNGLSEVLVSTDPPYYDNISYADLSDFFYVWLRRSLRDIYPSLFSTMLVPKREELIASPYRFEGDSEAARTFFEEGMLQAFQNVRAKVHVDYPTTIYYAFKQNDTVISEDGNRTASTGWETMLSALIMAGFTITGTWPMRTEMMSRSVARGANALASSIVLVCRPRPESAELITKREFISQLRRELHASVISLQSGNIAPVDLAQAAIGPGMAVFSRYKAVLEPNGDHVTVREALALINQELDAFLAEQEGELDEASRFCVAWYEQYGLQGRDFGEADLLSRAKNTSIEALANWNVFTAARGKARLLSRSELPEAWNSAWQGMVWATVQHLALALDKGGNEVAANLLGSMLPTNAANARALAYRLFSIAERKGWTEEALAYNTLVIAWPDIQRQADKRQLGVSTEQLELRI